MNMADRKKSREAASLSPLMGGHQSVDGNDDGAARSEDEIESLRPPPPRKSAPIAMAKRDDGQSYFDALSNELLVNIFHVLTGGADWHAVYDGAGFRRCSEAGQEENRQQAERYLSGIALSSTCTRMRAIASDMRYPLLLLVMPVNEDEEMIGWESYRCYVEYDTWG